ncbi:MAG: PQQ-like beta-propeller repeat protein [Opitutae bacterium]|nr:PQQ-like beta-propeller repeat protein [Opitutae bacterium]
MIRFYPYSLCCVLGFALIAQLSALGAVAQESAMFRGDARHTGVYRTAAPKNLEVKWTFATAEPIISSPAVADGVVYVGSSDNFLYALDAATGKLKWKFDAQGNVSSSPTVAGGVVYALSLDGKLYAVDAATGAQKWAFATEGERRHTWPGIDYSAPATETQPDPWDFFLSSPTLHDGLIYFGSGDHHVYAVDAATGALRWKFATGEAVHATPAVAGGRVYVGSFDSWFYALDAKTGALVWKFKTSDEDRSHLLVGIPGSAVVTDDGLVCFGCRDAHVYALDAATGALRWKHQTESSWVIASPALFDGRLCYATSDTLQFEVLEAKTGTLVFALPTNLYSFSSPAVAQGRAYFGTCDGLLHEVDLAAQRYGATFATPSRHLNAPRYLDADGKLKREAVWIGETLDDTIVGIRTRLFALGSIISSPVVHEGTLYVGSADGTLYALGTSAAGKP